MKRTRNTVQRRAVLETVRRHNGHPTAADVFAGVRLEHPNLSLATVYRALNALVERGEIAEMRVENVSRYDAGRHPHHHVVCRICGSVEDIPVLLCAERLREIGANCGFCFDALSVQFTGVCARCCPGHTQLENYKV